MVACAVDSGEAQRTKRTETRRGAVMLLLLALSLLASVLRVKRKQCAHPSTLQLYPCTRKVLIHEHGVILKKAHVSIKTFFGGLLTVLFICTACYASSFLLAQLFSCPRGDEAKAESVEPANGIAPAPAIRLAVRRIKIAATTTANTERTISRRSPLPHISMHIV